MEGNETHSWKSSINGRKIGSLGKPLENGHVLTFLVDSNPLDPTLPDVVLVELDWEGNIVWQYHESGFYLHHDFQRLSNGNTLLLAEVPKSVPAISGQEILDDVIREVDKDGNIVWEWSTAEHFDELELSDEAKQIIAEGKLYGGKSIFHTNSIQKIPHNKNEKSSLQFSFGNILVSQRNTNIVFVIDRQSGHIVWRLKETIGQHHVKMIPRNLVDSGNIMLFDNGGRAGYPSEWRLFSNVRIFNPLTARQVWGYNAAQSGKPMRTFFSPYISGAQRLANGNTLITEGDWGRIFEITPEKDVVWEYVSPYTGKNDQNGIYRAYRVELTWPTGSTGEIEPFPW